MRGEKNKLHECRLCGNGFSEADIKALEFFPSTSICYLCYVDGKQQPLQIWCFGKAYDTAETACRAICPDRALCPLFQTGKIKRLRRQGEDEETEG